ncbi:MAG: twin-arginine translocase TatA/TatE family subunit [Planctomycetes bacterium]|nr:twin-arginine translocase TatA/TatE family subunit [Planctomycetota bacterium]
MLALLNLGPQEMIVVLVVGLLIFGRRLPEVGRSIGKTLLEFRRGLQSFKDEMDRNEDLRESQRSLDDLRRDMSKQVNAYLAEDSQPVDAYPVDHSEDVPASDFHEDPGAPHDTPEAVPPLTVSNSTEPTTDEAAPPVAESPSGAESDETVRHDGETF